MQTVNMRKDRKEAREMIRSIFSSKILMADCFNGNVALANNQGIMLSMFSEEQKMQAKCHIANERLEFRRTMHRIDEAKDEDEASELFWVMAKKADLFIKSGEKWPLVKPEKNNLFWAMLSDGIALNYIYQVCDFCAAFLPYGARLEAGGARNSRDIVIATNSSRVSIGGYKMEEMQVMANDFYRGNFGSGIRLPLEYMRETKGKKESIKFRHFDLEVKLKKPEDVRQPQGEESKPLLYHLGRVFSRRGHDFSRTNQSVAKSFFGGEERIPYQISFILTSTNAKIGLLRAETGFTYPNRPTRGFYSQGEFLIEDDGKWMSGARHLQ